MLTREAETQTMDAEAARAEWPEVLDRVRRGETRVLVAADGRAVAAVISAEDFERLLQWEAERRADLMVLERSWAAFADVPNDELEREVDRALQVVRAENRRHRAEQTAPRS